MKTKYSLNVGDSFQGRIIERQLDRGLNPWRHVYKSGEEVLIVFSNPLIPDSFLVDTPQGRVPVEFKYVMDSLEEMRSPSYIKYKLSEYPQLGSFTLYGFPDIHDTGQNEQYTWIVEKYVKGMSLEEYVKRERGQKAFDLSNPDDYEELTDCFSFVHTSLSFFELTGRPQQRICLTPRSVFIQEDTEAGYISAGLLLGDMFCPSNDYHDYPASYDLRYLPNDEVMSYHSLVASMGLCFLSLTLGRFPFADVPKHEDAGIIWKMIRQNAHKVFEMGFKHQDAIVLYRSLLKPYLRPYTFSDAFNRDDNSSPYTPDNADTMEIISMLRGYSGNVGEAVELVRRCYGITQDFLLSQPEADVIKRICSEVETYMLELDMLEQKRPYDGFVEAICMLFVSTCEGLSLVDMLYEPSPDQIKALIESLHLDSETETIKANVLHMSAFYLYCMGNCICNLLPYSREGTVYYDDTVSKVRTFINSAIDLLRRIPHDIIDAHNQLLCCTKLLEELSVSVSQVASQAEKQLSDYVDTEKYFPERKCMEVLSMYIGTNNKTS